MLASIGLAVGGKVLGGILGASDANKKIKRDYINQLNANIATNKTIQESNLRNTIRTGYKLGIANVQAGAARRTAAQAGNSVSQQAQAFLGSNAANAAASGSIGSSTDAVVSDIKLNIDRAYASVDQDYEDTMFNFNIQMNDMIEQGLDSLQEAQTMDYSGAKTKSVLGAGLVAGIGAAAELYASNMKLGLGTPGTGGAAVSGAGFKAPSSSNMGIGFKAPGASYNYSPGNQYSLLGRG